VKGVDALIASVLIIIISIAAIFLALQLGGPSTQKAKEVLLMQEGKNTLSSIDNAVKNVLTEGEGSVRVLRFSVTGGYYKIENLTNFIIFSMDSKGQIIAEGVSKIEDGINFTGELEMIYLNLSYDNIQFTGDTEFGRGYHTLTIRNNGYNDTTQKQMIYISLTPVAPPTIITFTKQYNQTQTFVIVGTNTTSPINLNDLGKNFYNITEALESGGQFNYFQDSTENITGFNTTSADYTNSLDNQNYNVTSTAGQAGGTTVKQYNQTQTFVIVGTNTTSPNNLNLIDGQTYNVIEEIASFSEETKTIQLIYGNITDDATLIGASTTSNGDLGTHVEMIGYNAGGTRVRYPIIKINGLHTYIPVGATITNAVLAMRVDDSRLDANEALNYDSYHVYDKTKYNISNSEWTEGDYGTTASCTAAGSSITGSEIYWGNRPTTSGQMNLTYESRIRSATGGSTAHWNSWIVTNMVKKEYELGNNNVSILINVSRALGSPSTSDCARINSAEATTASYRPYLNITYTIPTYAYRAEIEHNTSVIYSGSLNSINISINFSTNVTSDFNLTIYNFNSESWNYALCQHGTATANNWYNWWCNVTTNPSYYNSSAGVIRIRLNGTDHSGVALIREEYVQYYVSSTNPTYYSNVSVEHNSSYIPNPSSITKINVTTILKTNSSSGIPFRFYIYNFSSDSWYQCSQYSINTTYTKMECVFTSNPSYYVSPENTIRVRLNSSGDTTTHQMMEDYLVYQITLPTMYISEVEHNTTGISYSGSLNNISISLNFSTNVSSNFNFTIYNFNSNDWEECYSFNPTANNWYMIWCNITTNPNYYLSSNLIRARLNETEHSEAALIREDYVQYYVTYTT